MSHRLLRIVRAATQSSDHQCALWAGRFLRYADALPLEAGDQALVTPEVPTWCQRTEPYEAKVLSVHGDSADIDCCPEPVPLQWLTLL